MSEMDYHIVADETMDSLTEAFEDIGDTLPCDPEYDAQYSVPTISDLFIGLKERNCWIRVAWFYKANIRPISYISVILWILVHVSQLSESFKPHIVYTLCFVKWYW